MQSKSNITGENESTNNLESNHIENELNISEINNLNDIRIEQIMSDKNESTNNLKTNHI